MVYAACKSRYNTLILMSSSSLPVNCEAHQANF